MAFYLAPGIYFKETNLTQRVQGPATSIGATVAQANGGPLGPQLLTNWDDFVDMYWPTASVSPANDCIRMFFTESSALWFNRVHNGGLWAGTSYLNDREGTFVSKTMSRDFPLGSPTDASNGYTTMLNIVFSAPMASGQSFNVEVSDGETTKAIGPIPYATDHNTTLQSLADSIVTVLGGYGLDGQAFVVDESLSGTADDRVVTVYPPPGTSLFFQNAVVTPADEEDVAAVTVEDQVKLFDIFAIGPGAQYSDVGVKVVNVDNGVLQRYKMTFAAALTSTHVVTGKVNGESIGTWSGTLTFSKDFVLGNAFNCKVNGVSIEPVVMTGSATSDQVMTAIAESLTVAIGGAPVVYVVPGESGTPSDDRVIEIRAGRAFTLSNAAITLGATQGTVSVSTITAVSSVAFFLNSDTTMKVIADAILGTAAVSSASVTEVPYGTANDRVISIVADVPKPDYLEITDFVVTGTAPPRVLWDESLKGVLPDGTFTLEIYRRSNVNSPAWSRRVSLGLMLDGFGNQLNIAHVVNDSAYKSNLIRVYQPASALTAKMIGVGWNGALVVDKAINWLGGGFDGAAVASSHVMAGYDAFANRNEIPVRMFINGGYSAVPVQQYMKTIAEKRRDTFFILDMPSEVQGMQDAWNYRRNTLNISSNYGAIYTPDLKILDRTTDTYRYVPPSGAVAASYARTDNTRATWFAPAGLTRGKIDNVTALRVAYSDGAKELLSPAQVNLILNVVGVGPVISDEVTLDAMSSILSFVHARRLMIYLEVGLTEAVAFSQWEPLNSKTMNQIRGLTRDFCQPIKDGEGLTDYAVVINDTNNKGPTKDAGELYCDLYLQITPATRAIGFNSILTKQGATFSEFTGG
jgi:hypothetical protein